MSGLKITVDANFTHGISVKDDERLNAGSILLIEPARDGKSGIPTSLRNYAASQFYANTGKAVNSVELVDTLSSYVGGKVERTVKGGIHGIVPTVLPTSGERIRFAAKLPQDVLDYCVANKTHSFYFAVVGVVTRNTTTTDGESITLAGINAPPNGKPDYTNEPTKTINVNQNGETKSVIAGPEVMSAILGRTGSAVEESPWLVDIAKNGMTFPDPVNVTQARSELFTMGARGTSTYSQGVPSWVLYSIYLEDLTVSGRTYEQCRADGEVMFNRRFGENGNYANDAWTIPS